MYGIHWSYATETRVAVGTGYGVRGFFFVYFVGLTLFWGL